MGEHAVVVARGGPTAARGAVAAMRDCGRVVGITDKAPQISPSSFGVAGRLTCGVRSRQRERPSQPPARSSQPPAPTSQTSSDWSRGAQRSCDAQ
jgi:hypothetical protein